MVIARLLRGVVLYIHFGGFVGYSSGNVTSSLNRPPSQMVFSFPGTPTSHFLRSIMPFAPRMGFAKKPKGWSRRHCFLGRVSCLYVSSKGTSRHIPLLRQPVHAQSHYGCARLILRLSPVCLIVELASCRSERRAEVVLQKFAGYCSKPRYICVVEAW